MTGEPLNTGNYNSKIIKYSAKLVGGKQGEERICTLSA